MVSGHVYCKNRTITFSRSLFFTGFVGGQQLHLIVIKYFRKIDILLQPLIIGSVFSFAPNFSTPCRSLLVVISIKTIIILQS